ncbi:MAG TPA: SIS domain-containing protein [Actinomycetota bacterium]|nr:SIS domain-containing protein [Actinomycetota bacterium]
MGGRLITPPDTATSVLDDAAAVAARDPSGALGAVASMATQVGTHRAGAARVAGRRVPLRSALFLGMGGSGVAGDLASAAAAGGSKLPVVVHRGCGVPAFCDESTFVVAASYSGSTAETLDGFRAACSRGAAHGAVITSGGPLAEEATAAQWEVWKVPEGMLPRFALGSMAALAVDLLAGPGGQWQEATAAHLQGRVSQWGPDVPLERNEAKRLAVRLEGTLPVVWGGAGATGVASARWRTDLNENSKVLAHAANLPELAHNEIVGLAAEGREGRPRMRKVLVCLREPDEDQRIARAFEAAVPDVRDDFEDVIEVQAQGADLVTRFFDLALLGGLVSVYLAILRGVDALPIDSIARLKRAISDN